MNTSSYTAMPQEREVLLYDGAKLKIVDVVSDFEVEHNNQKHTLTKIILRTPERK